MVRGTGPAPKKSAPFEDFGEGATRDVSGLQSTVLGVFLAKRFGRNDVKAGSCIIGFRWGAMGVYSVYSDISTGCRVERTGEHVWVASPKVIRTFSKEELEAGEISKIRPLPVKQHQPHKKKL